MVEPKGVFADEGVQRMIAMAEQGEPLDDTNRTDALGEKLGAAVGAMQFLQELRTPAPEDVE